MNDDLAPVTEVKNSRYARYAIDTGNDRILLGKWPWDNRDKYPHLNRPSMILGFFIDGRRYWQPLVLRCRPEKVQKALEPAARKLYEHGRAIGYIGESTFEQVV